MPSYAEIRRQELRHIEQSLKDDRKMKQAISKIYRDSSEDIQRHIDADIMRFADKENVSMAEAKKIISKTDVEAFQSTAKRYVEDRDFSPKANAELRKFNVTMRTNREELLQARINLETIDLALQEERLTEQYITSEAIKEYERQAGILNMSVPSQTQLNRLARSVALSDVSGATFSDRIWANQNELRSEINNTIRRALIRGEHPRNSAAAIKRLVRDEYGMKKRAADRIAITEVARAQTIAGVEAFKAAEVDKMMWIAEPDACPICSGMDGKVFSIDTSGLTIPAHPFCRCSYAGYVDNDEQEEANENRFRETKTIEDAKENTKEILGGDVDFNASNIDPELINEYNKGIADVLERFPELEGMTSEVKISRAKNTFASYGLKAVENEDGKIEPFHALTISNMGRKEGGKKRMEDTIAKATKVGHFKTSNTIRHTGAHEMAHAIEFRLLLDDYNQKDFTIKEWNKNVIARGRSGVIAKEITDSAYESIGVKPIGREAAAIRRDIGKYAATNNSEFFAEAFADGIISENPLEFSKAVVEETRKRFK